MLFPVALLICCFCLAVRATVTDFLSAILYPPDGWLETDWVNDNFPKYSNERARLEPEVSSNATAEVPVRQRLRRVAPHRIGASW
jgi:hypothetical protein